MTESAFKDKSGSTQTTEKPKKDGWRLITESDGIRKEVKCRVGLNEATYWWSSYFHFIQTELESGRDLMKFFQSEEGKSHYSRWQTLMGLRLNEIIKSPTFNQQLPELFSAGDQAILDECLTAYRTQNEGQYTVDKY